MLTATEARALHEQQKSFSIEEVENTIRQAAKTTRSTMFPAVRFSRPLAGKLVDNGFDVHEAAGNVVVSW